MICSVRTLKVLLEWHFFPGKAAIAILGTSKSFPRNLCSILSAHHIKCGSAVDVTTARSKAVELCWKDTKTSYPSARAKRQQQTPPVWGEFPISILDYIVYDVK